MLPENVECYEVHHLCWPCREGFGGGLDYRFVRDMLIDFGFDGEEKIVMLQKIQVIEQEIKKLRDKEPKE